MNVHGQRREHFTGSSRLVVANIDVRVLLQWRVGVTHPAFQARMHNKVGLGEKYIRHNVQHYYYYMSCSRGYINTVEEQMIISRWYLISTIIYSICAYVM